MRTIWKHYLGMTAVGVFALMTTGCSKEMTPEKREKLYVQRMEAYQEYYKEEIEPKGDKLLTAVALDTDALPVLWVATNWQAENAGTHPATNIQLFSYDKGEVVLLAEKNNTDVSGIAVEITTQGMAVEVETCDEEEWEYENYRLIYDEEQKEFVRYIPRENEWYEHDYDISEFEELKTKPELYSDLYFAESGKGRASLLVGASENGKSELNYYGVLDNSPLIVMRELGALESFWADDYEEVYSLIPELRDNEEIAAYFEEHFAPKDVSGDSFEEGVDYRTFEPVYYKPDGTVMTPEEQEACRFLMEQEAIATAANRIPLYAGYYDMAKWMRDLIRHPAYEAGEFFMEAMVSFTGYEQKNPDVMDVVKGWKIDRYLSQCEDIYGDYEYQMMDRDHDGNPEIFIHYEEENWLYDEEGLLETERTLGGVLGGSCAEYKEGDSLLYMDSSGVNRQNFAGYFRSYDPSSGSVLTEKESGYKYRFLESGYPFSDSDFLHICCTTPDMDCFYLDGLEQPDEGTQLAKFAAYYQDCNMQEFVWSGSENLERDLRAFYEGGAEQERAANVVKPEVVVETPQVNVTEPAEREKALEALAAYIEKIEAEDDLYYFSPVNIDGDQIPEILFGEGPAVCLLSYGDSGVQESYFSDDILTCIAGKNRLHRSYTGMYDRENEILHLENGKFVTDATGWCGSEEPETYDDWSYDDYNWEEEYDYDWEDDQWEDDSYIELWDETEEISETDAIEESYLPYCADRNAMTYKVNDAETTKEEFEKIFYDPEITKLEKQIGSLSCGKDEIIRYLRGTYY